MATMNVSLPDPMKVWVEAQTKDGRYSNASDYVRDLIRRDQERRATATLELKALLEKAEASGVGTRPKEALIDAARAEARQNGLLRGE
ncbi:type II toxin-antitoxin system ParD family antitoxin [Yoonia sp. SS1-5]|uniref:Type II toxin-antitoxin system ParD family antitoxin n=1 Tax=Yoonia rhodophyticola TaxID=3137370 RepID=A0AAN0M7C1_9RHOB